MGLKHKYLIAFLLLSGYLSAQKQIPGLWIENTLTYQTQQAIIENPDFRFQSGILPFFRIDSLIDNEENDALFEISPKVGGNKNAITFYPIVNLIGGVEFNDSTHFIGQAGVGLAFAANLGKQWEFYGSAYIEGQNAPNYMASYIDSNGVVPGMGKAYSGLMDYNFSRFDGFIRFIPVKEFLLELGIGKQFIGEGYRSLLWSDFSTPSPYFRLNLNIWHINFSATYTSLNDLSYNPQTLWQDAGKYTARHYLSWNISKTVEIGFFETVVWQAADSNYNRGFDFNYLNPIIFYRPVEFSLGSADNSLLGLNFKFDLAKKWTIYTQFLLDEFLLQEIREANGWWANKYAWQIGVKLNTERNFFRAEFNLSRPFTYSHGSVKQNYATNHQPLAHPLGANFYEGLIEARFKLGKRGMLNNFMMFYLKGEDPSGENFGGDIFKPYTNPARIYGNYIGQGDQRIVWLYKIQYNYLLSKENNMNLLAGIQLRTESFLEQNSFSTIFYLGISTQIWNRYSDF
jgi:hypothetical protein